MNWEFKISGFASAKRAMEIGCQPGDRLVETSHVGEHSAYVEIEAWRERMKKGDVTHVELIDLRPGGNLTNLRIYLETEIPWSWCVK